MSMGTEKYVLLGCWEVVLSVVHGIRDGTIVYFVLFFNETATTAIYTYGHTLSLHDALPICGRRRSPPARRRCSWRARPTRSSRRSEEHTSELQSLMRISYAVFCLKQKTSCEKLLSITLT